MAVVAVYEKFQQRRSSMKNGSMSHTRVWGVTTDDIRDGTAAAIVADGIPQYQTPFADGDPCVVTSLDCQPVDTDGTHFDVTVQYTDPDSTVGEIQSPLDRPADISYGATEVNAPYFLDCSTPAKRVVNSAGDPFEQYLEREDGEMAITITVNEATHDAVAADAFSHTINAGPVTIDGTTFDTGTLKLSPITATKTRERVQNNGFWEDFTYYKRTYVVKARKKGWSDKVLDVGLNERQGDLATGFTLKPILDFTQQSIKKPWPLDGSGKKQSGDTTVPPVELEFKPYTQADFLTLKPFTPGYWDDDNNGGGSSDE